MDDIPAQPREPKRPWPELVLILCLYLAPIAVLVAVVLMFAVDSESNIVTGTLILFLGSVALVSGSACGSGRGIALAVLHVAVAIGSTVLIAAMGWSPNETVWPMTGVGIVWGPLSAVLAVRWLPILPWRWGFRATLAALGVVLILSIVGVFTFPGAFFWILFLVLPCLVFCSSFGALIPSIRHASRKRFLGAMVIGLVAGGALGGAVLAYVMRGQWDALRYYDYEITLRLVHVGVFTAFMVFLCALASATAMRWRESSYQYTLRTLLIAVTILSMVMAGGASYWNWFLRRRFEFRQAAAPILEAGGHVYGRPERGIESIEVVHLGSNLTDTQLAQLIPHLKRMPNLYSLRLSHTQVTDAGLEPLSELKDLMHLIIVRTPIKDQGLKHVGHLTNLTWLILDSTQVGDAGLKHISKLEQLGRLSLSNTQVTDAGMVHLAGLTEMEHLRLGNTGVGDAGLVAIKPLVNLMLLDLGKSKVTDAGLVHLKSFQKLQYLNLSATQVTDDGLASLKGLKDLKELSLHNTQITDAGLEHLRELPSIERVELYGTQVTPEGIERLHNLLPYCDFRQ